MGSIDLGSVEVGKNNDSVLIKIDNFDAKKYERVLIVFELILTIFHEGKLLKMSSGSSSISLV